MLEPITWTNSTRKLSELIPWPINPAQIGKDEAKRLEESLAEFGQIQTIAVSPTNEIYDGHQRQTVWGASRKFGMDYEVDVRVSSRELTEQERKKLVIYLRKGTVGSFDWDILANNFEIPDLLEWGFSEKELTGLDFGGEKPEDPGAQIDKAEELREKWGVCLGQLWQLGEHRLICGDCTDKAVVERVMQGEKAQVIFTDPPYGVDYDGGAKKRDKLEGDEVGTEIYYLALPLMAEFADDNAPLYLWYADGHAAAAAAAAAAAGYQITAQIIWAKNQAQFVTSAHYKGKHEPCYYAHKKGKSARWFGPNNEVTLWECDRSPRNDYHPTQKPVELAERAIRNSSKIDDIVVDGFLGGGTTLIACERLGRKCRAIEISPAYVSVALERWQQMTGGEPILLESDHAPDTSDPQA
jgi:DNA modification methylase